MSVDGVHFLLCPKQGQGFKPSAAHLYPNIRSSHPHHRPRGAVQQGRFSDVRLLFFKYPAAEKIVVRVDRPKAEMLSADTLLRNWRILTSWSGRGVGIISDTDTFSDISDNTFICGISTL